jgi:uncharacterized protein (DUF1800 family)
MFLFKSMPSIPPKSPHRPVLAALLSLILTAQPILAAAPQNTRENNSSAAMPLLPTAPARSIRPASTKLDPDERILHLLNRMTFGPTPEQIAAVRKMGIEKWFDQQLHPQTIADSQLETRLAEFPALRLPVNELMNQFPSGAEIRQIVNGRRPMPDDPTLYAIYNRHIAMYEEKQAKKAETNSTPKPQSQPAMGQQATGQQVTAQPAAEAGNMTMPAPTPTKREERRARKDGAGKVQDSTRPAYADLMVASVLALPPAERVTKIISMQPTEYEEFRTNLKGPGKVKLTADLNPIQKELLGDYDNPTKTVIDELQAQRLLRDIYSQRQLQEVMTTFWMNHFNVYLHKNEETPYYLVSYERDVIAPRALGNFEDLLIATAVSPAMLIYLDNSSSTGPNSPVAEKQKLHAAFDKVAMPKKANPPGLNENYARELMELHTLGVNGGYTQKDVTEVAKVFTGWTIDKPGQGGPFKFDPDRHEPGKKLVLGKKIKEDGSKEGLQVLHMLATSPATAHFISRELAVAFVSDNPPQVLVDRMAQTFLKTHGDIPSILRTMLHGPEFWSPEIYQAKVKTPLEYVVSAARASGADITNTQPLVNNLNQMGMPLYACIPPTGYAAHSRYLGKYRCARNSHELFSISGE